MYIIYLQPHHLLIPSRALLEAVLPPRRKKKKKKEKQGWVEEDAQRRFALLRSFAKSNRCTYVEFKNEPTPGFAIPKSDSISRNMLLQSHVSQTRDIRWRFLSRVHCTPRCYATLDSLVRERSVDLAIRDERGKDLAMMVVDKERDTAMNYLHIIIEIIIALPISYILMHTHFFMHTLPQRSIISRLLFAFLCFFLLLITLYRNIFVLGPAQLCISRNDDGSYDVTVLAGRGLHSNEKGCLSRKTGGCDFSGSQSHILLASPSKYIYPSISVTRIYFEIRRMIY